MSTTLKSGTRIQVRGCDMNFNPVWEDARIGRQPKDGYPVAGYHLVRFADGGALAVHESNFRVTDNRAAGE